MRHDDDRIQNPRAVLLVPSSEAATVNLPPLPDLAVDGDIDVDLIGGKVKLVRLRNAQGGSEIRIMIEFDELSIFKPGGP